jgi:hypothetical protein
VWSSCVRVAARASCDAAYAADIAGLKATISGIDLQLEIGGAGSAVGAGAMAALGALNPFFGVFMAAPVGATELVRVIEARKLKSRIHAARYIMEAEHNQGPELEKLVAKLAKHGVHADVVDVSNVISKANTTDVFCRGENDPFGKAKLWTAKKIEGYVARELAQGRR